MIDEFKLLEYMAENFCDDCDDCGGSCRFADIVKCVEAQPKVGEWIPCSERLPKDETLLYWTTHEDGSLVLHGYKKAMVLSTIGKLTI